MKKGITISFSPAEQAKFRAWVRKQKADTKYEIRRVVYANTIDFERRAKISAKSSFQYKTVNLGVSKKYGKHVAKGSGKSYGILSGSIHHVFSANGLGGMVYAGAHYAPYQEFGTGKYAPRGILPGYEAYAWQFKGRGIRDVNIYPKMFFFPHFERVKKTFIRDLRRLGYK